MKIMMFVSAALVAATVLPVAAPAAAQDHVVVRTTERDYHHARRHWHHRVAYRNECHTVWRHHHRERVCTRVRSYG